jgi:hypothetical protein
VNPEAGTATGLSADKLDGKDSIEISSVYYLTKQGGVPLATGGTTRTQVATLSGLPAGDYLVTANVVAVNFSPPDFVRCNLEVGGTSYPGSTATPGVSSGFSNAASQITTTAAVALTSSGDATLSCLHDTSGRTPSVESIRIYAIRTGELHAQTVP